MRRWVRSGIDTAQLKLGAPFIGEFGEDVEAAACVLARLVSWVEVAEHRKRPVLPAFGLSRGTRQRRPNLEGSPPTSFSESEGTVAVEGRVLDTLGLHRAGVLLELHGERRRRASIPRSEVWRLMRQEHLANEREDGRFEQRDCVVVPLNGCVDYAAGRSRRSRFR